MEINLVNTTILLCHLPFQALCVIFLYWEERQTYFQNSYIAFFLISYFMFSLGISTWFWYDRSCFITIDVCAVISGHLLVISVFDKTSPFDRCSPFSMHLTQNIVSVSIRIKGKSRMVTSKGTIMEIRSSWPFNPISTGGGRFSPPLPNFSTLR